MLDDDVSEHHPDSPRWKRHCFVATLNDPGSKRVSSIALDGFGSKLWYQWPTEMIMFSRKTINFGGWQFWARCWGTLFPEKPGFWPRCPSAHGRLTSFRSLLQKLCIERSGRENKDPQNPWGLYDSLTLCTVTRKLFAGRICRLTYNNLSIWDWRESWVGFYTQCSTKSFKVYDFQGGAADCYDWTCNMWQCRMVQLVFMGELCVKSVYFKWRQCLSFDMIW